MPYRTGGRAFRVQSTDGNAARPGRYDLDMSSSLGRLPFRLRFDLFLEALVAWVAHGVVPYLLASVATVAGYLAGQWRAVDLTIAVACFAAAEVACLLVLVFQAQAGVKYERAVDRANDHVLELQRARFALRRLEREREDLDAKAARLEALVLSCVRVRQEHQRGSSGASDESTLSRLFALLDGKAARR